MKTKKTRKSTASEKEVKIAQLGTRVESVLVDIEATVEDCLVAGGFDTNVEVKCGGKVVSLSDVPDDGDRLVLADKVKDGR